MTASEILTDSAFNEFSLWQAQHWSAKTQLFMVTKSIHPSCTTAVAEAALDELRRSPRLFGVMPELVPWRDHHRGSDSVSLSPMSFVSS